jgi:hypothetical protein
MQKTQNDTPHVPSPIQIRAEKGEIKTRPTVIPLAFRPAKGLPSPEAKHTAKLGESRDVSRESRRVLLTLG